MKKILKMFMFCLVLLPLFFGLVACGDNKSKTDPSGDDGTSTDPDDSTTIETTVELTDDMVTLEYETVEYAFGSSLTPEVIVVSSGTTLTENSDYVVYYSSNILIGTATVIVNGTGNYTGTIYKNFEITKIELTEDNITLSQNRYQYLSFTCNPEPSVSVSYNGYTLTSSWFAISYSYDAVLGDGSIGVGGAKCFVSLKEDEIYSNTSDSNYEYVRDVFYIADGFYVGFSITNATFSADNVQVSLDNSTWFTIDDFRAVTIYVDGKYEYYNSTTENTETGTVTCMTSDGYIKPYIKVTVTVDEKSKVLTWFEDGGDEEVDDPDSYDYSYQYKQKNLVGTNEIQLCAGGVYEPDSEIIVTFLISRYQLGISSSDLEDVQVRESEGTYTVSYTNSETGASITLTYTSAESYSVKIEYGDTILTAYTDSETSYDYSYSVSVSDNSVYFHITGNSNTESNISIYAVSTIDYTLDLSGSGS